MNPRIVAIFLAMLAVTYVSRALPLVAFSRTRMPGWLATWLSHVPAAVLGSLAASSVFLADGELRPLAWNGYLVAAVPTLLVAARTKNLTLSVVVGMTAIALLRALGLDAVGAG